MKFINQFVVVLTICTTVNVGRAQPLAPGVQPLALGVQPLAPGVQPMTAIGSAQGLPSSYLTCVTCVQNNHRWCDSGNRGNCVGFGIACEKGAKLTDKGMPWNCITDCRTCIAGTNQWCSDIKDGGGRCYFKQYEKRGKHICEVSNGKWATSLTECPALNAGMLAPSGSPGNYSLKYPTLLLMVTSVIFSMIN